MMAEENARGSGATGTERKIRKAAKAVIMYECRAGWHEGGVMAEVEIGC